MMEIIIEKNAGFCYGVKRAVTLAENAPAKEKHCVTLGPIIHNQSVTDRLRSLGIGEISSADEASHGDVVIIRSHGITKAEHDTLIKNGAEIIDATCPNVSAIHKRVSEESKNGRHVVIIGERDHPEVIAISGWCDAPTVLENPEETEKWLAEYKYSADFPISVVSQTTMSAENLQNCVKLIKKQYTNLKLFDTICSATALRQKGAAQLAQKCDAVIVIGSRQSANSRRLSDICRKYCPKTGFIETADEIDLSDYKDVSVLGITAGASTPAWIIKEVNKTMSEEIKAVSQIEEESFEELLEKSIKTLHNGERVVGVVAAIGPTEISVDLGTKQSGYIPLSEFSDDPTVVVSDVIKVGDEIEAFVTRVNDVEGTVALSKKRLDAVRIWDDIGNAKSGRDIVEGIVKEENKGGVVVNVKGIRVFVPASQTGLPKDAAMTELVNKKVKLIINEVNQGRRRVVGSIRDAERAERKALAEAVWNELEVGKHYEGTVKSLTSYGAFVDIGGIDGMVHISELTWARIKNPAEVVSVGDKIDVYVISFDKEKNKISLGHKDKSQNPWEVFNSKYGVDSVASVKIVKLMDFGAFAEIIPGIDGLIHISQIADRRIGKPSEVLTEGQVVDAKIVDINEETKKISLSIRALIKGEKSVEEQAEVENKEDEVVFDSEAPVEAPAEEAAE